MNVNFSVDVIIPTYHPDEKFHVLMRMLREQTYPIHKIVIMNTGTSLPEEEHYRRHLAQKKAGGHVPVMEVYHIRSSEFDHGGTRGMAASWSMADICVFMTQDAVPDNDRLIEELVAPYQEEVDTRKNRLKNLHRDRENLRELTKEEKRIAAVYARQLPAADCRLIERYTREFNYPDKDRKKTAEDLKEMGIKTFFCSNVCAAYRMDLFRRLGGFEKRTIFNEDMIYAGRAVKAGYAIYYASKARVVHSHNYSGLTQFHRNFDMAVSQADHPEIFQMAPSENEGIRLVKSTAGFLVKQKKPWLIVPLIWQSGCKYLGYLLGKNYKKLPMSLVRAFSMQKSYWDK